jgi:hypothetical protein
VVDSSLILDGVKLITWNKEKTVGKSQHAFYRISERHCPGSEEKRLFTHYQAGAQNYEPQGKLTAIGSDSGYKTKEEAIAVCEENAEYDKQHL